MPRLIAKQNLALMVGDRKLDIPKGRTFECPEEKAQLLIKAEQAVKAPEPVDTGTRGGMVTANGGAGGGGAVSLEPQPRKRGRKPKNT